MPLALDLGIVVTLRDLVTSPAQTIRRSIGNMGQSIAAAGEQMQNLARDAKASTGDLLVAAGAIAAVGAAFTKAALDAGEFERQIAAAAFIAGATGDELQMLRDTTVNLATELGVLPTEVAKAEVALARLGFKAQEVASVIEPSLKIVQASFGELGPDKAGRLIGQTLKSFGKDADQATIIANELARATAVSALDFKKLGLAMGTAAGFAASFGAETSELLALLGAARDVIERTERGATGIRNIFRDLTKTEVQTKLATGELGIQVVNLDGSFRNIIDIIGDLGGALDQMTDSQKLSTLQNIFSIEAASVLAAVFKRLEGGVKLANGETLRGVDALRELVRAVKSGTITIDDFANIALGGSIGQFERAKAAFAAVANEVGASVNLGFVPALKLATGAMNLFRKTMEATGGFGRLFFGIIGVGAQILGAVGPTLFSTAVLMKAIGVSTNFATLSFRGFFTTLLTGIRALFRFLAILLIISLVLEGIIKLIEVIFGVELLPTLPELPELPELPSLPGEAGVEGAGAEGGKRSPGPGQRLPGTVSRTATDEGISADAAAILSRIRKDQQAFRAAGGDVGGTFRSTDRLIINLDGKRVDDVTAEVQEEEQDRRFERRPGGSKVKAR